MFCDVPWCVFLSPCAGLWFFVAAWTSATEEKGRVFPNGISQFVVAAAADTYGGDDKDKCNDDGRQNLHTTHQ